MAEIQVKRNANANLKIKIKKEDNIIITKFGIIAKIKSYHGKFGYHI